MKQDFTEQVIYIFQRYFGESYEVIILKDDDIISISTKHLKISKHDEKEYYITKKYPASIQNRQDKLKISLIVTEIEEMFMGWR